MNKHLNAHCTFIFSVSRNADTTNRMDFIAKSEDLVKCSLQIEHNFGSEQIKNVKMHEKSIVDENAVECNAELRQLETEPAVEFEPNENGQMHESDVIVIGKNEYHRLLVNEIQLLKANEKMLSLRKSCREKSDEIKKLQDSLIYFKKQLRDLKAKKKSEHSEKSSSEVENVN